MAGKPGRAENVSERPIAPARARRLSRSLLTWYDRARRRFPWRALPGDVPDPYRVWLAEIMLQQTTTTAVVPYYEAFLDRWPRLEDLARAPLDDVLHAWAGLGYYARARNLHRAARLVVDELGGRFPSDEAELRALPGIGAYSAPAIAAIAFDRRAVVVDGNVTRVLVRLAGLEQPPGRIRREIRGLADALTPLTRSGDYAQAMMDLGAAVCMPRAPDCPRCPWRRSCVAKARGIAGRLPRKDAKPARRIRHGVVFWATRPDGRLLLRRRAEQGLLGGMIEVPSTEWRETPWALRSAKRQAPLASRWRHLPGVVSHGFAHFDLELTVLVAGVGPDAAAAGSWYAPDQLGTLALPTLTKKIIQHVRNASVLRSR